MGWRWQRGAAQRLQLCIDAELTLKTDERKKALELSRNWLREEIKNKHSAQPAISHKASPYRKILALMIGVAALAFCVIIIVLINNLSQLNADKQEDPVNQQSIEPQVTPRTKPVLSTTVPTSSSAPNLSITEQPEQNSNEKAAMPANNYPSGWPDDVRYPAQFTVMDANTVRTHDNELPAYAVQMRFEGDMQTAAESFSSYFAARGWRIVERSELDSGAISINVARNGDRDSGNIIIDPDPLDTGKVRITAIIFF
jgi:hypothetical protein